MSKKILIVGDVILDRFQYGTALGISAETPTVVAKEGKFEEFYGGAALVGRHIEAQGGQPRVLTMAELDKQMNIVDHVKSPGWKISKKTRCFVDRYKMVQYDNINEQKHDADSEKLLLNAIRTLLPFYDTVVVADNRHGVISKNIAEALVTNQDHYSYNLYVDSQFSQNEPNHQWYKNCHTMFMNEKEYEWWRNNCLYKRDNNLQDLEHFMGCNIIVKLGYKGAMVLGSDKEIKYTVPWLTKEIVDTCGAGDAFMAAYLMNDQNTQFATDYASWSCSFKGTEVPTKDDYLDWKDENE